MKNVFDCIIIGGGPAGCMAGIHLQRSGFNIVLIEKERIGGSLHDANIIENYPGFPAGIKGLTLAKKLEEHLFSIGVKVIFDEVLKIKFRGKFFDLVCKKGNYRARSLIVAIGLVNREKWKNKRIKNIYTRARDLKSWRNKVIAILGLGDTAFDASLRFSSASKIYLIGRKIKAIKALVEKVKEMENVKILNKDVLGISESKNKIIIRLSSKKKIEVDKVLICYGKKRNNAIFPENIKSKLRKKLIEIYPGLFIAGDFAMPEKRYISIAFATGIMAAEGAIKYLRGEK
ncbi:MAG: NAD(P)/FAD-dependent oxidoreductase [Thermoplasmatales archaeon]|nr:NAD(P)/FAD-dependent oxidoreductase [Thermoplasmatales archaeon]